MYRILIAEDESRIAQLLSKGLHRKGFQTFIAKDGSEALAMAKHGSFDLLLLDIGLPDIDGIEVLRELQASQIDLPVIILSARVDESDIAAGYANGASAYMTKPFKFADLIAKIDRIRVPE